MLIEQWVFYVFSAILVAAGVMMITSSNPVRSALFLVLAFFASAVLWMMLEAEFLALILIFVYVGAVMTLFLFVVMMLNLQLDHLKRGFVQHLPLVILIVAMMVVLMVFAIAPNHFATMSPVQHGADYSNIKALGEVLYTQYAYPFELAAVLLLVAIIAAISLSHVEKKRRRVQDVNKQVRARREDNVRLVDMPGEKRKK